MSILAKRKPIDISGIRHLYPFTSHYLDLNGFRYHYLDEGRGEPVVMLHGNPTWSFYYRNLVRTLTPQFRTIVPDHIGCGLSAKPGGEAYDYRLASRVADLENLLATLRLGHKVTLVLHDWGGMIGMTYAVKHPENISRIVIMNTAAFLPPRAKRPPLRLMLVRNLGPLAVVAVLGFNIFVRAALVMAARRGLAKEVRLGLTAPYNCWAHRIATLKFVQDIPLGPEDPSYRLVKQTDENLHRLASRPMLICWGGRDFVFDPDYLAEWQRRFPDAEVHRFPDAGHYLLEDAGDEVAAIIRKFLVKTKLQP